MGTLIKIALRGINAWIQQYEFQVLSIRIMKDDEVKKMRGIEVN